LNIFIYGNGSFKSDIHKIFERSNIKSLLSENDSIQEINVLNELRIAIESNPKDIFLIDDAKIFRKNALNQKIKFLKPNDVIEEEFIKEHDIDDISINSLDELPKYVIQKLEEVNKNVMDDDYHNSADNINIQESIINIVDEAYSEENNEDIKETGNIDEENDKIQLDDELSSLLVGGDMKLPDDDEEESFYLDEIPALEPLKELEPSIDDTIDELSIEKEPKIDENIEDLLELEGDDMSDEFSELDNLNESDILAALDGLDDVDVASVMPASTNALSQGDTVLSQNSAGLEIDSKNVNDIAALITQLLNNKTLEITIKVKE